MQPVKTQEYWWSSSCLGQEEYKQLVWVKYQNGKMFLHDLAPTILNKIITPKIALWINTLFLDLNKKLHYLINFFEALI